MKKYAIHWTHVLQYSEYQDVSIIWATNEQEAERKFYATRPEYNPYTNKTGYIIDNIIEKD